MADITITIPDVAIPRLRAALAEALSVPADDLTTADLKQYILNNLQQVVNSYERKQLAKTFVPEDMGAS